VYPARAAFTALAIQHQIPEEAKRKAPKRSTKRQRSLDDWGRREIRNAVFYEEDHRLPKKQEPQQGGSAVQ
jgi:hypothetical protein